MCSLHANPVPLRQILRVVLTIASFLMSVPATPFGACLAGVPAGNIKAATDAHIPVGEVFVVILLAGGRGLARRLSAPSRWGGRSKRRTFTIPAAKSLLATTVFSTTAYSSSTASVGSSSATSGGCDVCRRWLIRWGSLRCWLICG